MARVGANEAAGEDGSRKLLDVARLERCQETDGDFRRGGNLIERDVANEPLPAEFFPESEVRFLAHSLLPGRTSHASPRVTSPQGLSPRRP